MQFPQALPAFLLILFVAPVAALCPQEPPAPPDLPAIRECLVLPRVAQPYRAPLHVDAIEARRVAGTLQPPSEGEAVALPGGGEESWARLEAGEDGWFRDAVLRNAHAYVALEWPREEVVVLRARGHDMVFVNGVPRVGDRYATGFVRLPVRLVQGANELLFLCHRGRLSVELERPRAEVYFDADDRTVPDLVVGEAVDHWAALLVVNAGEEWRDDLSLEAVLLGPEEERGRAVVSPAGGVPGSGVRKVGFRFAGAAPVEAGERAVALRLLAGRGPGARVLDETTLTLAVREPHERRSITFQSEVDGSVQYYALKPARPPGRDLRDPALFLSLHGAGVQARRQAGTISAKSWGHVVAPTNRRPFGFDWEDWGRLDFLEVFDHARASLGCDPARTYLSGHSMGGHGTLQLGALYPDRFAAIGPSAGWLQFSTYGGAASFADDDAAGQMFARAAATSDTRALAKNWAQHGVYVLHGDRDDNVPVEQARDLVAELERFHRDFRYHEQPGVGHWWDHSDEPGADCNDWAPMYDFFARRALPPRGAVRAVDFTTVNPAVSAESSWARVEVQERALLPSRVQLRCDPVRRRFTGTTENVRRLSLDVSHLVGEDDVQVALDGGEALQVPWPEDGDRVWLERVDGGWSEVAFVWPGNKNPQRGGPFKLAFRNRAVLVYGTGGTAEENAWAEARARYDAETFWYRGNGSFEVVPDVAFEPDEERDRNVVLYGNAVTNLRWTALLDEGGEGPVRVAPGSVQIGERGWRRDDLACLFVRPRPGSDVALVAAVAGTGLPGMRLTERLPYFVTGLGYPDFTLLSPAVLAEGTGGVLAAGFFGETWTVEGGEFAW